MSGLITLAKGFVAADIAKLPKNVQFFNNVKDGLYMAVHDLIIPRDRYYSTPRIEIKKGDILTSTENGHYYKLDPVKGFSGLGKTNRTNDKLKLLLVQRVSIDVTVSDYKKPRRVTKKKVTKKKVTKKKAVRRKR